MVQYIRELCDQAIVEAEGNRMSPALLWMGGISEEIDRLDPRDFLAAHRSLFVQAKHKLRAWISRGLGQIASNSGPYIAKDIACLREALDGYAGEGSRSTVRDFAFIADADLREIVERDYKELCLCVLPSGAWKSTVVLAGSILEAILTDLLASDPATKALADAAANAPRVRVTGAVRSLADGEWTLHDLIEVADELDLLPQGRVKAIDQVLRDYRNYVHPKKEVRSGYPCTEAEALMAKGALDAVCNHFG